MKQVIILIILIVLGQTVKSQTKDSIVTLNDITIKYNSKFRYAFIYENADFKIYFNKNDILNLLDSIKISNEDKEEVNSLKCFAKAGKDSIFINENFFYLPDSSSKHDYYLRIIRGFHIVGRQLFMTGDFRIFDKQSNNYLSIKKLKRIMVYSNGDESYSEEEYLMIGEKKLYTLWGYSIFWQPSMDD